MGSSTSTWGREFLRSTSTSSSASSSASNSAGNKSGKRRVRSQSNERGFVCSILDRSGKCNADVVTTWKRWKAGETKHSQELGTARQPLHHHALSFIELSDWLKVQRLKPEAPCLFCSMTFDREPLARV